MAEPKKRHSVVRSKNRRRHQKAAASQMAKCPVCGEPVAKHRLHRTCVSEIKAA